jgi:hypothetical protein
MVACLEDLARATLWAYEDPDRSAARRQQDEYDLIRLTKAFPHLRSYYSRALLDCLG